MENNIIKTTLNVEVVLPNKDGKSWNVKNLTKLVVTQHYNPQTYVMWFTMTLPKFMFDLIKDSDEKYETEPIQSTNVFDIKKPKFTQNLRSNHSVKDLLNNLNDIGIDILEYTERKNATFRKYIAIKFNHSNQQRKDSFNFASMGFETKSSFQYFVVYKIEKKPNSLNRYIFKSNIRIGGNIQKDKEWHWFTKGIVESYQLVTWTQEREDFFKKLQDKFNSINKELDTYLGELTDEKLVSLMSNNQLLIN